MQIHAVFRLLVAASVFHLTLVGRDVGCTTHEAPADAAPVAAHEGHEGHGAAPAQHPQHQTEPTECPAGIPVCCQIVPSCAVATTGTNGPDGPPIERDAMARSALASIHLSPTSGPEPPPPKA